MLKCQNCGEHLTPDYSRVFAPDVRLTRGDWLSLLAMVWVVGQIDLGPAIGILLLPVGIMITVPVDDRVI